MDYQLDSLPEISNRAWNIFRNRGMQFIHLNIDNSLQSKIDEIRYIAKLANATVIGLSETKLDHTVSSSGFKIGGCDLVRSDQSQREVVVACFVKNSISYNRKPNFYINTKSIFTEIFLPKSKPVLIGILYWLLYKYDSVNCLERTFNDTNVIESHDCYVLNDININLQYKDKESFRNKYVKTINKEISHLTRIYLEFCFTRSLEQIITRPTKFHWSNCHPYWSYTYKLTWQSQSVRCLSDHDLI